MLQLSTANLQKCTLTNSDIVSILNHLQNSVILAPPAHAFKTA